MRDLLAFLNSYVFGGIYIEVCMVKQRVNNIVKALSNF